MSEMDTIQPDQLEKWHTSKIVTSNLTCLMFHEFSGRNVILHGKKKTSHPSNFHAAKVLLGRELNILQACGSVDQLEATLKYQNLAAKMAQRNQRKGMKLG